MTTAELAWILTARLPEPDDTAPDNDSPIDGTRARRGPSKADGGGRSVARAGRTPGLCL